MSISNEQAVFNKNVGNELVNNNISYVSPEKRTPTKLTKKRSRSDVNEDFAIKEYLIDDFLVDSNTIINSPPFILNTAIKKEGEIETI